MEGWGGVGFAQLPTALFFAAGLDLVTHAWEKKKSFRLLGRCVHEWRYQSMLGNRAGQLSRYIIFKCQTIEPGKANLKLHY